MSKSKSKDSTFHSVYVSEELIIEILKRLPVKSLLRFMSVCRSWYTFIKNHYFIFAHLNLQIANNNNNDVGPRYLFYQAEGKKYLMLCDVNDNLELHQELTFPEELNILDYCNSIICFGNNTKHLYVLWNLSLKKTISFGSTPKYPDFNMGYTYGFGFDACSNDFKYVWINYFYNVSIDKPSISDAYVYSLNVGCWYAVKNVAPLRFVTGSHGSVYLEGVHLDSVIHWIIGNLDESVANPYSSILTFNLCTETFGVIPLPKNIEYSPDVAHLTRLRTIPWYGRERLAYVHDNQSFINVWVMTEYNVVASWRLVTSLNRKYYTNFINVRVNGEYVVEMKDGRVVTVDFRRRRIKVLSETSKIMNYLGNYVESLVLL